MRSVLLGLCVLIPLPLQTSAQGLALELRAVVTPDDGGPERLNGTVAVSESGAIAFTLGFDRNDRLVTILDRQKRMLSRIVRRGNGPGEFTTVLAMKFVDSTLFIAGAGQVSAFTTGGRHLWSRAVPPLQLMIGAGRDSIDLLDARYFADGRGVGSVYRRSVRRGGGERMLLNGSQLALRRFASNVDDSTRFPRLGISVWSHGLALANAQTGAVLGFGADGVLRDTIVRPQGIRRRTPRQIDLEARAVEQRARRPYKLPDGRFVSLPFNSAALRQRLLGPVSYFNARLGGFNYDPVSRLTTYVESRGDSTLVTRFGPGRGEVRSAMVECSGDDAVSAIAGAYLLLGCVVDEDGDAVPTLRLYQIR